MTTPFHDAALRARATVRAASRRRPAPAATLPALLLALLLSLLLGVAAGAQEAAPAEEGPQPPAAVVDPATPLPELSLRLIPLTVPELEAAAGEWLELVKGKSQELVEAQIELLGQEGDAAAATRERIDDLTTERKAMFDAYIAVIDAWEKKGGDEAAIAPYRAYRSAIVVEETRLADVETLTRQVLAWATSWDGGLGLAVDIAVVIVALLGLIAVARMVRGAARRGIGRVRNLSKLLQAFLVAAVYWVVLSIGLMVVLSMLGIDITPVFALIGGASFILAFALQSTLSNLAAGLMIMINRPFDEGDYVDVGGVAGTVKSVSIVSTTVTTPDNQVIVIPNANVWGNVITNVTTSPTRRVDLVFGIGYGDSIEAAQGVLEGVVAAHPLILKDPAPTIRVHALGESSVDFIVRPWVQGADYWTVYWDLTRQVKEAFDAAGISIPFPQRDVHVIAEAPSGGALAGSGSRSGTGGQDGIAAGEPGEETPGATA